MLKYIAVLLVFQAVFLGNRCNSFLIFRNLENDHEKLRHEDYEKLKEMRGLVQELGASFNVARLTNNR